MAQNSKESAQFGKNFNYVAINERHTAPNLLKSFYGVDVNIAQKELEDLQKAEGSKGGKVIGHTKSGKPIYSHKEAGSYEGFTKEDHLNAYKAHKKAASNTKDTKENVHHTGKANKHHAFSITGGPKEGKAVEEKKAESTGNTPGAETVEKYTLKKDIDLSDDELVAKGETPAEKKKIKKVMDEFKNGTLKTSAGEKVTERSQAIAIAISESKNDVNKGAISGSTNDNKEELDEKREKLKKSFESLGLNDLEESDLFKAEGSRGGRIIGHTKSGKPIYENASYKEHKDFTPSEHREAVEKHRSLAIEHKENAEEYDKLAIRAGTEGKDEVMAAHDYARAEHTRAQKHHQKQAIHHMEQAHKKELEEVRGINKDEQAFSM